MAAVAAPPAITCIHWQPARNADILRFIFQIFAVFEISCKIRKRAENPEIAKDTRLRQKQPIECKPRPEPVDRMKTRLCSVQLKLTGFLTAIAVALPACLCAQTLTLLHSFTNSPDGNWPLVGLIVSGNTLYGTTTKGAGGLGMVFRVNTDGTCFTNLHSK